MNETRAKVVQIVQMVLRDHRNHVLLLQRANTGFLDGHFTLPGGHVEAGEEIIAAAVRECREETRIKVLDAEVKLVMPYQGGVDYVVMANEWSGTAAIGEPESCSSIGWFPTHALPNQATDVVRTALKLVERGITFHQYG